MYAWRIEEIQNRLNRVVESTVITVVKPAVLPTFNELMFTFEFEPGYAAAAAHHDFCGLVDIDFTINYVHRAGEYVFVYVAIEEETAL